MTRYAEAEYGKTIAGVYKTNVSLRAIHMWVAYHLPKPYVCPKCGINRKLELSNTPHTYKRDLKDWEYLCHYCHAKKDGWGIKSGAKRKGRLRSEETKRKISKTKLELQFRHSEESKKKMSAGHKNKPWSQAQRDAHNRRRCYGTI
jgi:hypothetical protein